MLVRTAFALAFILLQAVAPCAAATFTYTATLSGAVSLAVGTVDVFVDEAANTMTVAGVFTGLTSAAEAAHIHCCATPPTDVAVGIPPQSATFPQGLTSTTSGTFDVSFEITQARVRTH